MTTPNRRNRALRALWATLWQQPIWAIPFGLFFGTLSGGGLATYWLAYKVSLVFAYFIRLAIIPVVLWYVPSVQCWEPSDSTATNVKIVLALAAASLGGAYAGAALVHFTFLPGFLGSSQVVSIGMYSLVFFGLIAGIRFAMIFHRQAIERARAVEQMRAELAQAELRALRAQINPHFLFNTLNSIAALIAGNPQAAEDTTTRLADVFRYTLRASERDQARLGDELDFLRSYLGIEHTRFGARLRIEEHVEPGLSSALVPSLLLQPLVENAVRYAVAARPEGGTVRLAAHRRDDTLVLEVSDDGPGFTPGGRPTGTGFGLHSVRERLRAAGHPDAITVTSRPEDGTHIRITLPLQFAAATPAAAHVTQGGSR